MTGPHWRQCRPILFIAAALASPATAQVPAATFAPFVDYHQHLASPDSVKLLIRAQRTQEEVAVPSDVAALLRFIEDNWNNQSALSPLYSENAVVLSNQVTPHTPWTKGRVAAAGYIASLYGRPYRLTPVLFDAAASSARVAGFATRSEGTDARHFGYFFLQLERTPGDRWQISADHRIFDPRPYYQRTIDAEQLLKQLNEAGIQQAVVLSNAYWFDAPAYRDKDATDAQVYAQVRAENDWTAEQTARSKGRLVAFCSFNPRAEYAVIELRRCAASRRFAGIKLHLQMSGVDLHKAADVAAVKRIFAEADRARLAITVHAQTQDSYDAAAARNLVRDIFPEARHIPVIIAHLWGGGPFAKEPLDIFAEAAAKGDPAMRNVYFDVAEAALVANGDKDKLAQVASAIRKIGTTRILFGSDAVGEWTLPPPRAAAQFRSDLPLTAKEFDQIASNRLAFTKPTKRPARSPPRFRR